MASVTGNNGSNNILTGTNDRDRIYGDTRSTLTTLGGNDTINALDGDDYIYGDAYRDITGMSAQGGNDTINGDAGNDIIYGDGNYRLLNGALGGNDTIDGGVDDDIITGDVRIAITGAGSLGGDDDIIGGSGNDRIDGDSRDDITNGGQGGVDTVHGGLDNDRIYGDAGDDLINATGGGDFLYGEDGDDIIAGDAADDMTTGSVGGDDTLDGGIGNDTLFGDAGGNLLDGSQGGVDTITGGVGDDIIFGDAGEDLNNSAIGGNDGLDGGDNNDLISGDAGNELKNGSTGGNDNLQGGDGDDRLYGDAVDSFLIQAVGGIDTIDGGLGADIISGDAGGSFYDNSQGGNDILMAGNDTTGGPNIIYGDAGNTIYLSSHGGDDTITGSEVTDIVYGDAGVDIYGNSTGGNDTINTLGGGDEISGDAGRSLFDFAVGGNDIIDAGAGNDTIYGDAKLLMRLNAQGGDDTIHGGDNDDIISGDAGHKLYENAIGGDDTLYGDDGDDLIVGDTLEYITSGGVGGNDTISGGAGDDRIYGDTLRFISSTGFGGNDKLQGDAGNDLVFGNAGDDIAYYNWDVNNLVTPYSDRYSGGEGSDTLVFLISANSDLVNIATGVQAFNQFLTTSPSDSTLFDFNPYGFDLVASGFAALQSNAVAINDSYTGDETSLFDALLEGVNLFDNDNNYDADILSVIAVEGEVTNVGNVITLASGATVRVQANGDFVYDPNGAFDGISGDVTDTFTYSISDGLLDINNNIITSQATVSLTLLDSPATLNFNTSNQLSMIEYGINAGTITATSLLAATPLTYSIVGGADAVDFAINSTTGRLTTKAPPNYQLPSDFDKDNVYEVDIQVMDSLGNTLTETFEIAITINGDLDIVTSSYLPDTSHPNVYINNSGSFTANGETFGPGLRSLHLAIADINADDLADVFQARGYVSPINTPNSIEYSNGNGQFTTFTLADSNKGFGAAVADFNGDGLYDLFSANAQQPNEVLIQQPAGTFATTTTITGDAGLFSTHAVVGDMDKDGDIDIIVRNLDIVELWENDGSGNFTVNSVFTFSTNSNHGLAVADINNDDYLDIILPQTSVTGSNIRTDILLNNHAVTANTFISGTPIITNITIISAELGDVDGNGTVDLIMGTDSSNIKIFSNDGTGAFTEIVQQAALPTGRAWDIDLGDYDGDNDLDIVHSGIPGTLSVLENDGTGQFSTAETFVTNSYGVHFVDVDFI